jgi:hypothetical protein
MSTSAGVNAFTLMTFTTGIGPGSATRLVVRAAAQQRAGRVALRATTSTTSGDTLLAGAAAFAPANPSDPATHNNRIDFTWRAGSPGHLTMWRTRFTNGAPNGAGCRCSTSHCRRTASAVINHVSREWCRSGRRHVGSLYLDELSFRR